MNELIQALEKIQALARQLDGLIPIEVTAEFGTVVAEFSTAKHIINQIDDTAFFAIQKGKKWQE